MFYVFNRLGTKTATNQDIEQMEKEGITRSRRKKAIKNLENSSDSEKYLEVQMALKECAKVNRNNFRM